MPARARLASKMHYLDFLGDVHRRLDPGTYLEIGVRNGKSLALASCPSIGIDPAYNITVDLDPAAVLERTTSDDYFARPDACASVGGQIDLAFIDGMHLFEFALRDFVNVEKHCSWSSIIVFDDVFPSRADIAARDRHTWEWTGDVFRIVEVLRAYRPDLTLILADTKPSGLLMVTGLDPQSTVLEATYDEIVGRHVRPDPQPVPPSIRRRAGAVDPSAFLASGVLEMLRVGRDTGSRSATLAEVAATVGALGR
ncbi:class I SAM-dependent methyltransferase [Antribacter gilvus]|uniref:class I SAM-dependent methyltransferase n=1 Tax=Antribacter gilvus TaxID=2304675 RepID=UPI0013DEB34C|nr:class I SAM-dependent methyltransferase [Antribacter gilvus]